MTNFRQILFSLAHKASREETMGVAHYSYGFAADKFRTMFEHKGLSVLPIWSPEQFKSEQYAKLHDLGDSPYLHFVFRSTEDIRPIPRAYNIACVAWEFETMRDDGPPDEFIMRDQVVALNTCDRIWTPCTFTKRVMEDYGVKRVDVIPAPIAQPTRPRLSPKAALAELGTVESVPLVSSSKLEEAFFDRLERRYAAPLRRQQRLRSVVESGGSVFLLICNAYDHRKNLANLIDGFLMAAADRDDAILLVKLIGSREVERPAGQLYYQIRRTLGSPHCIHSDKVVFASGFLEDEQMESLYDLSDFYLSAAVAEGQNLPLQEAMAHGCIPVSTRNTAMSDYIDDENAVVIPERRYFGLNTSLAIDFNRRSMAVDVADRYQIAGALRQALALSPEQREAKAAAARRTIAQRFSPDAIFARAAAALGDTPFDLIDASDRALASSLALAERTRALSPAADRSAG